MCVQSMVMDSKADDWLYRYWPPVYPLQPVPLPPPAYPSPVPLPTAQEIEEFRRLLERARQYDRDHAQPDGETEAKRRKLREMADALGVAIEFV